MIIIYCKTIKYELKSERFISRRRQIQKKLPCFRKISYPWAF